MNLIYSLFISAFLVLGIKALWDYFQGLFARLKELETIAPQMFTSEGLKKVARSPFEAKFVEFVLKRSNDIEWWYIDKNGQIYEYRYQQVPSLRAELVTVFKMKTADDINE